MSNEEDKGPVTDKELKKWLPKGFTLPKSAAARADLLYTIEQGAKIEAKKLEPWAKFPSLLRRWFIENLPAGDAKGIIGAVGKVEINRSEVATVKNWKKFYSFIAKNTAFELLNKTINQKAVREYWEAGKKIPGTEKFQVKKVSVTKVKGK